MVVVVQMIDSSQMVEQMKTLKVLLADWNKVWMGLDKNWQGT